MLANQIKRTPFFTNSGEQINYARMLMCHLLAVMDHHGFELVASVDQSIGSDSVGERECLSNGRVRLMVSRHLVFRYQALAPRYNRF